MFNLKSHTFTDCFTDYFNVSEPVHNIGSKMPPKYHMLAVHSANDNNYICMFNTTDIYNKVNDERKNCYCLFLSCNYHSTKDSYF